jgi:RNA polymerase sigma-70 factor (ECF subfamily)
MEHRDAVLDAAARTSAQFATTHWSTVLAAGDGASPNSREALETLCRMYWFPVYAFIRRKGYSPEDAQDLTQSFFADFLARHAVDRADPNRGRFRTFLLACLQNFLSHERDRALARKRGGGRLEVLDLADAERRHQEQAFEGATPETLYEKHWALSLLERVLERLRADFLHTGSAALFEKLKPHLWQDEAAVPYERLAGVHRMSEGALRVTVYRLRLKYREILRDEIAQTVASPDEVDDEIRHLRRVLSER